jgi:hypothetical protein
MTTARDTPDTPDTRDTPDRPHSQRDDPAAVAFITTEHFDLQSARSTIISETNGRASVFLSAVSAGLVAMAFAGQTSRTALYTIGLVLFPVLCFLGLVTFGRALQTSIDDTHLMLRINRIRRYYVEAAPQLAPYLARPSATDQVADVLRIEGFRGGRWQLMLSIVGALGVINSVLFGVTAGLVVGAVTDSELWAATPVGLVVFAIAVLLHQRHQQAQRLRAHDLADLFVGDG